MKKYLLALSLIASWGFSQQPIEITYEAVNKEFQTQLSQIFQEFVDQQSADGSEVVVTFYDNLGEPRISVGTSGAPSYLRVISNYKAKFLRDCQLTSTKGVSYMGTSEVLD